MARDGHAARIEDRLLRDGRARRIRPRREYRRRRRRQRDSRHVRSGLRRVRVLQRLLDHGRPPSPQREPGACLCPHPQGDPASRTSPVPPASRRSCPESGTRSSSAAFLVDPVALLRAIGGAMSTNVPRTLLPELAKVMPNIDRSKTYRAVITSPLVRPAYDYRGSIQVPDVAGIRALAAEMFPRVRDAASGCVRGASPGDRRRRVRGWQLRPAIDGDTCPDGVVRAHSRARRRHRRASVGPTSRPTPTPTSGAPTPKTAPATSRP